MSLYTITPDIEKRLSAWHNYVHSASKKRSKPCVTISREFGCEGYPVAEALVKAFESDKKSDSKWVILDQHLLEKLAIESGISTSEILKATSSSPFFQTLVSMFLGKTGPDHFEVHQYLRKAILHFANNGNTVIVGRGGAAIAAKVKSCIHIRIVAPLEFRVNRIMKIQKLTETEALKFVQNHQYQREEFVRHFTGQSLSDPTLYHLIFNNEKSTPTEIAEIINDYLVLKKLR